MTISEIINRLTKIRESKGDINVCFCDDTWHASVITNIECGEFDNEVLLSSR